MLFFICVVLPSLANAQHNFSDSNEAKSYGNSSSCIRRYRDLQSYVLNTEDLMDDLSELFFETGKMATELFIGLKFFFLLITI